MFRFGWSVWPHNPRRVHGKDSSIRPDETRPAIVEIGRPQASVGSLRRGRISYSTAWDASWMLLLNPVMLRMLLSDGQGRRTR